MNFPETPLGYYERTSCSAQWLEFNRALAAELSAGLPPEEVRQLFARIGAQVATALPIGRCDSVPELQAGFNARWESISWGFSSLREVADHLEITHACSPFAMAFGPASADWAGGFFEGAYQTWFASQGIPAGLHVRAEAPAAGSSQIVLRLGKQP
ncbi:MAG: cellulose biosynthesis protein BcsD [Pseudomonadota bacterium]